MIRRLMILIGLTLIIIWGVSAYYWSINGPYCCTHICCATMDSGECFMGMILNILLLVGFFVFIGGFIIPSEKEAGKK